MKNTEIEFFNVLKAVKGNSELNSEIHEESNETSIMDRSKLPDDRDSDEIKLSSVDSKQISKEYTHSQEIYKGQINPPSQKNIANENMKKRATPLNTHKEISMATPKFTEEEYQSNKMLEKIEYNISDEKDNQLKFKEETKISKEINLPLKLEDSKKIIIKKKNQESKLIGIFTFYLELYTILGCLVYILKSYF